MVQMIIRRATLNDQLWQASLLYLGIGCLLVALAPAPPSALAGLPGGGCGSGMKDCHGTCIDEDSLCCEDGSYGDAETCACCTGCIDSGCTSESTIVCVQDVEEYINSQDP